MYGQVLLAVIAQHCVRHQSVGWRVRLCRVARQRMRGTAAIPLRRSLAGELVQNRGVIGIGAVRTGKEVIPGTTMIVLGRTALVSAPDGLLAQVTSARR